MVMSEKLIDNFEKVLYNMNTLSIIASLFAIIGGFYGFYKIFIKPKRTKTKLSKLLTMIVDWFDELDCNLEKELNLYALNNKENKIRDFIDNRLPHYKIKPKKRIIKRWNKKMGIKKELQNSPDIFEKYSRISVNGISVSLFFSMIVANFYKFHRAYKTNNKKEYNFDFYFEK
jgi:hypothetical protein